MLKIFIFDEKLKLYFNLILILILLAPFYSYAQDKEEVGYILFPKCEKLENKKLQSCNSYELRKFIAHNTEYPANILDENEENEVFVKYVLTKEGKLNTFLVKDDSIHPSFGSAAMQVMGRLKDSVDLGSVKVIPAKLNGTPVESFYKIPIYFNSPKEKKISINSNTEIVIATYRTYLRTVQFRKDISGNIRAYSLQPEGEKLLIVINGNSDPFSLTSEEQSYFFLYNLTFLKTEILLTLGKIKNKYYEIYIDKSADTSDQNNNSMMQIKVYSEDNYNEPEEVYYSVDELIKSKYSVLIFK